MADENKVSDLVTALNDLRQTSNEARVSMHANVAKARPVDAWAAMGEAYPGGAPSPSAASLASVPPTQQTLVTEATPVVTDPAKKSLSYVTEAAALAQASGVVEPLYKSMGDPGPLQEWKKGSCMDTTEMLKSIQARPTYMPLSRDPFSDDFYKSDHDLLVARNERAAARRAMRSSKCSNCGEPLGGTHLENCATTHSPEGKAAEGEVKVTKEDTR